MTMIIWDSHLVLCPEPGCEYFLWNKTKRSGRKEYYCCRKCKTEIWTTDKHITVGAWGEVDDTKTR